MNPSFVVSAVNIVEGGPLTLLKNCISFIDNSDLSKNFKILILVHKIELFNDLNTNNIEFIEFTDAKKNYINRLKYEYIYFSKFAKEKNVKYWLSLHDISPRLNDVIQFVYCHNPSPFRKTKIKDLYDQPKLFLFSIFYKYLYRININSNKYVIVQQNWLKEKFQDMYGLCSNKIIVAPVEFPKLLDIPQSTKPLNHIFFYPTLSRPFKNIEIICEAVKILTQKNNVDFQVFITIDGSENNYAKKIVNLYDKIPQLKFIGLINKDEVINYYSKSTCLIFPSTLETWGLPLTEFKITNKPIIVSNLPYAKETLSNYENVLFFDPYNSHELAKLMNKIILNEKINFDKTSVNNFTPPYAESWKDLFEILIS